MLQVPCLAQKHLEPATFLFNAAPTSPAAAHSFGPELWAQMGHLQERRCCCLCSSSVFSLNHGGDASLVSNRWTEPWITGVDLPTPGDGYTTNTTTPAGCLKKINMSCWQEIIAGTRTSWACGYFCMMYYILFERMFCCIRAKIKYHHEVCRTASLAAAASRRTATWANTPITARQLHCSQLLAFPFFCIPEQILSFYCF